MSGVCGARRRSCAALSALTRTTVVAGEARRIPDYARQAVADGPTPTQATPRTAAGDSERKSVAFHVTRRGPAYRTLAQAARVLHTRPDTIRNLLSRGELLADQLEPNGPLLVSNKSIADYQTRLFQTTVAESRKKPRHRKP